MVKSARLVYHCFWSPVLPMGIRGRCFSHNYLSMIADICIIAKKRSFSLVTIEHRNTEIYSLNKPERHEVWTELVQGVDLFQNRATKEGYFEENCYKLLDIFKWKAEFWVSISTRGYITLLKIEPTPLVNVRIASSKIFLVTSCIILATSISKPSKIETISMTLTTPYRYSYVCYAFLLIVGWWFSY